MLKAKWTNYLILFLVVVMCLVTINTIQTVPDSSASPGGDDSEIVSPIIDEDDDDSSTSDAIVYKAGDSLLAWNKAMELKETADGYEGKQTGKMVFGSIGTQYMNTSSWRYSDGNYHQKTYSSGTAPTYIEIYKNNSTNRIYQIKGTSEESITDKANMTFSQYETEFGNIPDTCIYDIDESTILRETSFIDNTASNGTYYFEFELNPITATRRYAVMINITGKAYLGNNMPTFTKVQIQLTVYKSGRYAKIRMIDNYRATTVLGVGANCISDLTETAKYKYLAPSKPSWVR